VPRILGTRGEEVLTISGMKGANASARGGQAPPNVEGLQSRVSW